MYRVHVDFAPAHELVMSLDAYVVVPSHRSIDLGGGWVAETRSRLTPAFATELAAMAEPPDFRLLTLLIHQSPGARDATGFLGWLTGLSPGELYERLAPYALPGALQTDLGALRDRMIAMLSQWHEQYFRHVAPAVLEGLAADADRVRALAAALPPDLLVEEVTRGMHVEPAPEIREVWLVPQYHKRPIPLHALTGGVLLVYYPAADFPTPAGEPPTDLLRVTRALADESRLRLLHQLAGGPRSFMELVAGSGLTKGTVHRHLWTLRFAGLVRACLQDGRFSLRPGAFARAAGQLNAFVSHRS